MTAEQFIYENDLNFADSDTEYAMVEFAKMHVRKALEAASEAAELKVTGAFTNQDFGFSKTAYMVNQNGDDYDYEIHKPSILNAYPEENIK